MIQKYEVVCERVAEYDVQATALNPDEVVAFLRDVLKLHKFGTERFYVLMMDDRGNIMGFSEVGRGSSRLCPVPTAEVFRLALNCGKCAAIIAAHNHPSGNLKPSAEDYELTLKLKAAGELLGIKLMDHFIITEDGWNSMHDFIEEG